MYDVRPLIILPIASMAAVLADEGLLLAAVLGQLGHGDHHGAADGLAAQQARCPDAIFSGIHVVSGLERYL